MTQAGTTEKINIWAFFNCVAFLACGVFFVFIGCCFPDPVEPEEKDEEA